MKMNGLIKYDIKRGFSYNRIKFLLVFIFIVACCIYFNGIVKKLNVDASIGDLIVYFFKGEEFFSSKTGNIPFSITYLGVQIIIAVLIGYYPHDDINGYGKQIFIRCSDKTKWLSGKMTWAIATVLSFYICTFTMLFVFALFFGYDMSLKYHSEIIWMTNNIDVPDIKTSVIIINGIILPIIYSIVMSMVQMCISLGTNAILGFLCIMTYDFATLFFTGRFFLANYVMILRNTGYVEKYNTIEGCIVLIVIFILTVFVGRLIINRKQFI